MYYVECCHKFLCKELDMPKDKYPAFMCAFLVKQAAYHVSVVELYDINLERQCTYVKDRLL